MSWPAKIVTICGSMRFFDQMLHVAADETAKGHIVLAPFPVAENLANKLKLDELHREKIRMCSQIIVVTDQNGFVGNATRREMDYAESIGKDIAVRRFEIEDVVS